MSNLSEPPRIGAPAGDVATLVAEACGTLWEDDVEPALRRVLEVVVSEGLSMQASVVLHENGSPAFSIEVPEPAQPRRSGDGAVSVPIVFNHRDYGVISADLPRGTSARVGQLTGLLKALAPVIARAIAFQRARQAERSRLVDENDRLRRKLHDRHDLPSVVGSSLPMRGVCERIAAAAQTGAAVLLTGEAGTGKEFLARVIHHHSPWARRSFFEVNCSGVNESALEWELFGAGRGSPTGRRDTTKPRFAPGEGGTLFLDEVGHLTPLAQMALLKVLQRREFTGAAGALPPIRVIATTTVDLAAATDDGSFRPDLLQRLSGYGIAVPPLRERHADTPLLADFFLRKSATEHGKDIRRFSARAMDLLVRYRWPGNVRELANVVDRAVVLSDDDAIHAHHLPHAIQAGSGPAPTSAFSLSESMDAYEKDLLQDALKAARGVRSRAARLLKTTDRIFNYKIQKHGIDCGRFKL